LCRADVGNEDRCTAGERLQRGETEAFIDREGDIGVCRGIQTDEGVPIDVTQPPRTLSDAEFTRVIDESTRVPTRRANYIQLVCSAHRAPSVSIQKQVKAFVRRVTADSKEVRVLPYRAVQRTEVLEIDAG
jgi:hypothetical protein